LYVDDWWSVCRLYYGSCVIYSASITIVFNYNYYASKMDGDTLMSHYKAPDNSLHFLDDDAYAHLLPEGSVQITNEEAEALRPQPAELTYAQKRAAEYPPMTDYLDGVVKGDQAQIDKYIADCQAVKAKYPKV